MPYIENRDAIEYSANGLGMFRRGLSVSEAALEDNPVNERNARNSRTVTDMMTSPFPEMRTQPDNDTQYRKETIQANMVCSKPEPATAPGFFQYC